MKVTDLDIKIAVWQKGIVISGYDPSFLRRDEYQQLMYWPEYGNRNSQFGWEIDHVIPKSILGSDHISNLRPLNWRSNSSRQAGRF